MIQPTLCDPVTLTLDFFISTQHLQLHISHRIFLTKLNFPRLLFLELQTRTAYGTDRETDGQTDLQADRRTEGRCLQHVIMACHETVAQ